MRAAILLLLTAGIAVADYSYSVFNPVGSLFGVSDYSSFTKNGAISNCGASPCLISSASTAGSLIFQSTPSDYEVRMAIVLPTTISTSGGDFVQYVRASSDALSNASGSGDTGTFGAVHLLNPTYSSDGACTATLKFLVRSGGSTATVFSSGVPCSNGEIMRTVAFPNAVWTMLGSEVYTFSTSLTGGFAGVGAANNQYGDGISLVQIGPRDMTAP